MRPLHRPLSLTIRAAALPFTAGALLTVPPSVSAAPPRPGDPDITFGNGGLIRLPSCGYGATGLAVLADGRFLITGRARPPGLQPLCLAVWRFHPNGGPDLSFGGGTGRATLIAGENVESGGNTIVIRSDGRLLVGGAAALNPATPLATAPRGLLASFLPDGRPDPSFGPGGQGFVIRSGLPGAVDRIAFEPGGRILAAGTTLRGTMRYLPDGSLEPVFGNGGVLLDFNGGGEVHGLTSIEEGRRTILLQNNYEKTSCMITMLRGSGNLDESYHDGGRLILLPQILAPWYIRAGRLTAMPDRTSLIGAHYRTNLGSGFALIRMLENNSPAHSLAGDITVLDRIPFPAAYEVSVRDMAVQSDGRILLAGVTTGPANQPPAMDIALARFTANRQPDTTFGVDGRVVTGFGGLEDVRAMAAVPGHKLLVAGGFTAPTDESEPVEEIMLARFHAASSVALAVETADGRFPGPAAPLDFGVVTIGTRLVQLTLRNAGLEPLTELQTLLTDESRSGEFHLLPPPVTTLDPGTQTTATLSFTPADIPATRTASLHITSAAPGFDPFIIPLTGAKGTPLQIWRVTWFGSPDNSGAGADTSDFDHDGLPNFLEYALRTHPHLPSPSPCRPSTNIPGAFTCTRPAAALTEFSYTPESAPSPDGPWSSAALTTTILTDNGTDQTLQITPAPGPLPPHLFLRLRVTKL